ncbi:pyridoxal phosphate-dependent transferase [Bisporella sp. PMI_857]|nr:pyridoxal phosphate-dependent transferase [Bisporella sp. PMI_857]
MGGTAPLLSALSFFFNTYFYPSIPISPAHITTFAGASTTLDALLYAICDEGDSILIPSPFWGGYQAFTKFRANVNIVTTAALPFRTALSEDIVAAVKDAYSKSPESARIKALLVTNPHNPRGKCYSPSVLRNLISFCQEKSIHYISDEVYALSTFPSERDEKFESALSLVDDTAEALIEKERVHVIYSMSKDFGMPGLRLGCLVSHNRPVVEGAMLANYLQTSNLPSLFITALLTSPSLPSIILSLKTQLRNNYNILTKALDVWGIEHIPISAGFHLVAKLAGNTNEGEVAKKLAAAGVMVVPGKGGVDAESGWVRISFSIPEARLRDGIERIGMALDLKNGKEAVSFSSNSHESLTPFA